ncbi:MAG: hypothetical protein WBF81_07050 [Thermoplasmata archaeon]
MSQDGFLASNGSYNYSASAPGSPRLTGRVSVNDPVAAPVTLDFAGGAPSSTGLSPLDHVLIGAGVLVVALAASIALVRARKKVPPPRSPEPSTGPPEDPRPDP